MDMETKQLLRSALPTLADCLDSPEFHKQLAEQGKRVNVRALVDIAMKVGGR
jgi:hypothetical protein